MAQVRFVVRCRLLIRGTVQGVGFRPYIYRLATSLGLSGFVRNTPCGVEVEVQGAEEKVEEFIRRIPKEAPPASDVESVEVWHLPVREEEGFRIEESLPDGARFLSIPPDVATCRECLRELFDPEDRRYRYPFINCTNCGPRYTIILSLPYDRKNTTMKSFNMCPECLREYKDPLNRRYHAQPNACPECGPHVWLEGEGGVVATGDEAVRLCASMILEGKIVAVKGLGGFHLMCLAGSDCAVERLRRKKGRQEKPFAVMFRDLEQVKKYCQVTSREEQVIEGVERPIVLLRSRGGLSRHVSCGLKTVGAFLPYTPLHHLIMEEVKRPVVATSANITDEPIAKDNDEALSRLLHVADAFLMHNRDIARRCDDSVCFVLEDLRILTRRARGFAPSPLFLPFSVERPIMALGGHLKSTVAVAVGDAVYISQHIGDLDHPEVRDFFEETIRDLLDLLQVEPEVVVVDRHPGYYSTRFAKKAFSGKEIFSVQHHIAHVMSAACEAGIEGSFLGIALDGTGYGDDGTIWGGEVFLVSGREYKRVFHIKPFLLPGGDRASREGYRVALSLLWSSGCSPPGGWMKRIGERKASVIVEMLKKRINTFATSSAGRLFDAFSSLSGVRDASSYEAQAAMLFEQEGWDVDEEDHYSFAILDGVIDWRPAVEAVVSDVSRGVPASVVSKRVHRGFALALFECAVRAKEAFGVDKVVLSGGVFQNRLLLKELLGLLRDHGFDVYVNRAVPVNDGGISLGQIYAYLFFRGRPCA